MAEAFQSDLMMMYPRHILKMFIKLAAFHEKLIKKRVLNRALFSYTDLKAPPMMTRLTTDGAASLAETDGHTGARGALSVNGQKVSDLSAPIRVDYRLVYPMKIIRGHARVRADLSRIRE